MARIPRHYLVQKLHLSHTLCLKLWTLHWEHSGVLGLSWVRTWTTSQTIWPTKDTRILKCLPTSRLTESFEVLYAEHCSNFREIKFGHRQMHLCLRLGKMVEHLFESSSRRPVTRIENLPTNESRADSGAWNSKESRLGGLQFGLLSKLWIPNFLIFKTR